MAGIYDGHLNGSRPVLISGQRRSSAELPREPKASDAAPLATSAPTLPYAAGAAARHAGTHKGAAPLPTQSPPSPDRVATQPPPANLHLLWGRRGNAHLPQLQPPAPVATGRASAAGAAAAAAPPSPAASHSSEASTATQESVDFFGPFSPRT